MFMLLSNTLGAEEYGRFASMFSLGSFLGIVCLLGQQTRVVKLLPSWLERHEYVQARYQIRTSIKAIGATVLATSAVAILVWLVTNGSPETRIAAIFLGAAPFVLPMVVAEMFASIYRSIGVVGIALFPRDVLWKLLVIVATFLWGTYGLENQTAFQTMLVLAGLLLFVTIGQGLALKRYLPKGFWEDRPLAIHEQSFPSLFKESLWFWLAAVVGALSGHLSVVVTSLVLSDLETGAFFAAMKIAQLLQLPLMAVNIVAAPLLAKAFANSNLPQMQVLCRQFVPFLTGFALLGLIVIASSSGWLLSFFDAKYSIAATCLMVLTVGQFINAACGPTGTIMLMANGEKQLVFLIGTSEGLALGLTLILAPIFGLNGAAAAALIGKLGWNLAAVIWCKRNIGLDPTLMCLLKRS